ncbi:MAG TPA: VanZ family protein [Chitinophagaceae bacterium]|nr:VanZ family protein [Chitinophagaceae bacterium]
MKKIHFKRFLPGIAWFIIVLVLTCLPGSDLPKIGWMDKIYFDKWVHIGMFGGLTFLFCLPFYKSPFSDKEKLHYFAKIAIASGIWGLAIEFIQRFYVIGRSFDWMDWAADSAGSLIAFLISRKIFISKKTADYS